ncbi:MAG: DUF190 domain-containing protein [Marinilabilia sp.]
MENGSTASKLRVFIGSTDKTGHQILYEWIVFKAKEAGLAGVTVIHGTMGFGASSVIHSYKFWDVTGKVPVVVEIVDEQDKVSAFFEDIRPVLESMNYGCMVTMEDVDVLMYKAGNVRN